MTGTIFFLRLLCLFLCALEIKGNPEWSHKDPENWPGVCVTGKSQSPINFVVEEALIDDTLEPFIFHEYDKMTATPTAVVKNNGHTLDMELSSSPRSPFSKIFRPSSYKFWQGVPSLTGGGLPARYQFHGLHFHWGPDNAGSEHTFEGKAFAMELHLVHFNTEYGSSITQAISNAAKAKKQVNDVLAVLGIFVNLQNQDNPKLNPLVKTIEKITKKGEKAQIKSFPLVELLPRNTDDFFRYNGSLTTPGCNQIVLWTVFKDTIGISENQLKKFRQLMDAQGEKILLNYRVTQPVNQRQILDVSTSTKKFASDSECPEKKADIKVRILDPLGISDVFEDYEGFYGKKDSLADKEDKF